jgi:hypothetical protein
VGKKDEKDLVQYTTDSVGRREAKGRRKEATDKANKQGTKTVETKDGVFTEKKGSGN